MPAYAIVQVDVKDADEYAKYAVLAGPAVEKYGGEFLARGGAVEVMEGTSRIDVPVERITPVDATGAGDQFAAGFLFGLATGRDLETCARIGCVCAGEVISVSFPTDTMEHAAKKMSLRGNNVHFARATVHHELIPGHHLQRFMQKRYRAYRMPYGTPFWLEGWALYWEMLLWDREFPRSPENRIGMLFWRKHRCARIVFSLSYHLGKWNEQQCIDYLVERVGHEPRNATAEVRRSVIGGYEPLYQAAYMLGGLQIRALHREVVGQGRMTDREFHDAILRENSIPIELLRATLTDSAVPAKAQWRGM